MRLVSLSFDPDHDTPQRLAEYSESIRDQKSGCEWHFATAKSSAELESILNGYGQAVDKRSNPNDPQGPLYHILRVFLIDRDGRIRNIYSSGTLDPRLVLADVKTLLAGRKEIFETVIDVSNRLIHRRRAAWSHFEVIVCGFLPAMNLLGKT